MTHAGGAARNMNAQRFPFQTEMAANLVEEPPHLRRSPSVESRHVSGLQRSYDKRKEKKEARRFGFLEKDNNPQSSQRLKRFPS